MGTREGAVARALEFFDSNGFRDRLAGLVAIPSTSQDPGHKADVERYLHAAIGPWLECMGFAVRIHGNPIAGFGPILTAERIEEGSNTVALTYGHGDTVAGLNDQWRAGLDPWRLTERQDRWYGRGSADNKGQHALNLSALEAVIAERGGKLGFSLKLVLETCEERGSVGLREFVATHKGELAADVLIGSDRRVRLLDFGVGFLLTCERGKSLLDTMTNTRALARGVDCASPESLADPLNRTPAGDQYSLGCVLYYCLTGQFPFPEKNPVKKMLAHQFEEPQPVRELAPEVSPRLAAVVQRLMRKDPAERYESTAEAVKALQLASTSRPAPLPAETRRVAGAPTRTVTPSAKPDGAEKSGGGKGPLSPTWVGVGVAGGVLAGATLGWLLLRMF